MDVIGEMECEEHFKQVPAYHYINEPLYRLLYIMLLLPTKMLHLNAPFFPLKCSVSPKKSLKCSDNAHYTNGFFKINFKVYTYKNVQRDRGNRRLFPQIH